MKSYGSMVTVRMPVGLHEALKMKARNLGGSVSQLVRKTLEDHLPQLGSPGSQGTQPEPNRPTNSV